MKPVTRPKPILAGTRGLILALCHVYNPAAFAPGSHK
jgi:hypothetical protein